MILLCDPRVAAMPAADDGDPLIDLRDVPQLRLDERAAGPDALLRQEVVDRLLAAQRSLPFGLRLLLVEGYRPLDTQAATAFGSPVEAAPHSTGGAIDLTLCTADGAELDLGTALGAGLAAGGTACFTGARHIATSARWNRRIMSDALSGAGLVNYPAQWWHWSYGDRYWAVLTQAPHARYAPLRLGESAYPR